MSIRTRYYLLLKVDIYFAQLPVSLPPLFPDIKDELEEFLLHPESLKIHDYQRSQQLSRSDVSFYLIKTKYEFLFIM